MTRISYTLINLYNRGDMQAMIEYYIGINKEATQAMERGKQKDIAITKYIDEHKALPNYLGGQRLQEFKTQPKTELVFDRYTFVFIPDMVTQKNDIHTVWEWKAGVTDLSSHLSTGQLQIYMFLYELLGKKVEYGKLVRIEERNPEWYLVVNSPELHNRTESYLLEKANAIETVLNEYFDE